MADEKKYSCFCLVCGRPFWARGSNARYCPSCKMILARQRPGLPPAERLRRAQLAVGAVPHSAGRTACLHCLARDSRNAERIVCAFGHCVKETLRF